MQRNGQLAIVTGGSSGMGLEYARQLAGKGFDLLLVSNQEDRLAEAASEISEKFGSNVRTLCRDLAEVDAADALFAFCKESGTMPEILINNAGIFFFKELGAADEDRMDKILRLHILTPTRLCLLFGEEMKKQGHGYILNVSSLGAEMQVPGITAYSATKAYLKNFSKSLYYECRPYGVGVSVVCPGAVATSLYGLNASLMKLGTGIGVIKSPEKIVRRALRGMFRKRRMIRPGLMNYYLPVIVALTPKRVVEKVWDKMKDMEI